MQDKTGNSVFYVYDDSHHSYNINSSFDSRYKFTAKELDNETNYTYFGARYYDSDLSSWLSVDPMAGKGPFISPYSYCFNNPVQYVDPDGQWPLITWFWESSEIKQAKAFARATGGRYVPHSRQYARENGGVTATVLLHGTTAGYEVRQAYASSQGKSSADLDYNESDYSQTINFKEGHDYSNLFAPPEVILANTIAPLAIVLAEVVVIAPGLEGLLRSREEINADAVVDILVPDVGARIDKMAQHGKNRGKLEPGQDEIIRAKVQSGTATKKEKMQLKKHDKNTGARQSRQSKDKK